MQIYAGKKIADQKSDKELNNMLQVAFVQFIPWFLFLVNSFILDLGKEGIVKYMLDDENIVKLLSKQGNFYNEHPNAEISRAIKALPNDVGQVIGVSGDIVIQVFNLLMNRLVVSSPMMFINAFGIADASKQADNIKGQGCCAIIEDLILTLGISALSVAMPMLLRPKLPDTEFDSNIDDMLTNINTIKMSSTQKSEAKYIRKALSDQYSKQKFDNLKMFSGICAPYIAFALWGYLRVKCQTSIEDKSMIVTRMGQNMGSAAVLQQMLGKFAGLSQHMNSIVTNLQVVNAGIDQNDKGKMTVRLNNPEIKVDMPKGFQYSTPNIK